MKKNYYDELEISHSASQDVINKVYKVLAKKYHPDTTQEDKKTAEEKFKKISEAYETLSNAQKRKEYDEYLKSITPQIDVENYNKVLNENKNLSNQISQLQHQINNINNTNATNLSNINQARYTPNNPTRTYYQNNNHSYRQPTFIDIIKFRIHNFFKSLIALILTIIVIFLIFKILFSVPYTRNIILNTLNFQIFFDLLK